MQDNKPQIKRTKVCYVITKGNWGGAQKYVYALATSLQKDDYDTVVVCGEGETLPEKLKSSGVRTQRLPVLKRDISIIAEIKSFFSLLKVIKNERPDILHLNSAKAGGFGSFIGRLLRVKKIIYTAHGFAWNEDRGLVSILLITFFSWITIMFCHKTIVINEKEKKQALSLPFVTDKKIVLIKNGIEKISFKEKTVAREELMLRVAQKNHGDVAWFGTIAELHKNKGLEYAIEAMKKISTPFVFFIIGEGEERKNLEDLIEKYNLKEKVFFLGFVEEANQYLKAFDIFILSSIKEGLPYAILEAGQAGVPVVATSIGGIPDIIDNGESGILVTRARSGEIARAVEYLISNRDKQIEYGKNLKEKVLKKFSVEQMFEKTKELY